MREDTVYACLPASEDTLYTSISEEHPTVLPGKFFKKIFLIILSIDC